MGTTSIYLNNKLNSWLIKKAEKEMISTPKLIVEILNKRMESEENGK